VYVRRQRRPTTAVEVSTYRKIRLSGRILFIVLFLFFFFCSRRLHAAHNIIIILLLLLLYVYIYRILCYVTLCVFALYNCFTIAYESRAPAFITIVIFSFRIKYTSIRIRRTSARAPYTVRRAHIVFEKQQKLRNKKTAPF